MQLWLISVQPNNTHLITGMSDGTLSIRHRVVDVNEEAAQAKEDPQYSTSHIMTLVKLD